MNTPTPSTILAEIHTIFETNNLDLVGFDDYIDPIATTHPDRKKQLYWHFDQYDECKKVMWGALRTLRRQSPPPHPDSQPAYVKALIDNLKRANWLANSWQQAILDIGQESKLTPTMTHAIRQLTNLASALESAVQLAYLLK